MTGFLSPIVGIATSTPPYRVENKVSAKFAQSWSCSDDRESRKVAALYRRTGIEHRGSVLLDANPQAEIVNEFYPPAESPCDRGPRTGSRSERYAVEAPTLAIQAAGAAILDSGLSAKQITHVITVSCTGFGSPGIDISLIDELGLPGTTQRVQVGFMGCHAAINGLRVAQGLLAANPTANILMCCVELCSLHYQYGFDPDRIVSGALFADGAAAVILSKDDSTTELGEVVATGSCLVPNSREAMTWKIGDHGFEMTLSAQVPSLIESELRDYLQGWLHDQGESIESIEGWAVHPGGVRILSATETALGMEQDSLTVSRGVLNDHGNMSSATMLFILERFARQSQPKPWLMLGFGPGLEIEVALIR